MAAPSQTMTRPLLKLRIDELERLFADHANDGTALSRLKAELEHRSTPRAKLLRAKVEERLVQLRTARTIQPSNTQPHLPVFDQPIPVKAPARHEAAAKPAPGSGTIAPADPIDFGHAPVSTLPIKNEPGSILSAWSALEVLDPPSFKRPEDLAGGDRSRVISLAEGSLPWERGEKSRPKFRLYYQVVLGTVKLQPAVENLVRRFGDSRPDGPGGKGSAALAVLVLDRDGRLVESPAAGVSSFAWGLMRALKGDLADLAGWPSVEPELVKSLERHLLGMPRDDREAELARERPLTRRILESAFQALVRELGLPPSWVEEPSFAIRSYCYYKDPSPPDPIIVNSFFLADLARAKDLLSNGKLPANVGRYLGIERPQHRVDLLRNSQALADAVRPSATPPARWPARGHHPLVLLQQAAVNLVFEQTSDGGVLGINGPPGTGKTTLLRDVVAGVVAARAEVMCRFNDPEEAFKNSNQRLRVGEGGWLHLYQLNADLRGFEMIVASSNNKAVENVSAELPAMGAVADDAGGLRYFKTLSDALHEAPTWGAIAAVLGNAQNRSWFKQTFWWDDEVGLSNYLRAAAGFPVLISDEEGQGCPQRVPRIIRSEGPPVTREDALRRWNAARKVFQDALATSRSEQRRLERIRGELAELGRLKGGVSDALARHSVAAADETNRVEEQRSAAAAQSISQESYDRLQHSMRAHSSSRPRLWARLFCTAAARRWAATKRDLMERLNLATTALSTATKDLHAAEKALGSARKATESVAAKLRVAEAELARCKGLLAEARRGGVELVDETFFAQSREKLNLATPWFTAGAQRSRDEVFIAAMAVHRAFVDAAAKPLRHNLGALMNVFSRQTLPTADKQALLPDLWASLFLVVPLVSTTFASVNRMLGRLPEEGLGWLLVDEAGQALPQAAVGAMLRTKRALVVGDPVQIPPVVALPDALVRATCRRFGVDADLYAAPTASVQTLADAASAFATDIPTRQGSRTIGVPLLVHRRCSDPMFRVSNSIAYANLMVQAKKPRPSAIRDVLGPSVWIDVTGRGEDKWCEEEGKRAMVLLARLKQARVTPDLYIVSPFVIVAERMRQSLQSSGLLDDWVEGDSRQWTYERVGTVHTVQGREAEAVIMVLGAPAPGQTGARNWAGWPPNLLNVAVTRAKEVVYIIGNRGLWQQAGCFAQLDMIVPR